MSNNSTIRCPNCKHEFPIGNALAQEIENDIRGKYLKRYNEDKQKLDAEKAQILKQEEQLKLQTENQDRIIAGGTWLCSCAAKCAGSAANNTSHHLRGGVSKSAATRTEFGGQRTDTGCG